MEAAIATGAKRLLFFRSHHDEKNTMESVVRAIAEFRAKVQCRCTCVIYEGKTSFTEALRGELEKV